MTERSVIHMLGVIQMSPRMVDKEKKKREILMAAISVFARRGVSKSRMADIAAQAEIGKGTIYEYFRSQEEILTEAFSLVMRDMETKMKAVFHQTQNPEEKICAMMQVGYDALSQLSPDTMQIFLDLWSEGIRHRDTDSSFAINLKRIYSNTRRQISRVLDQGIDQGHFRKMDTSAVASCLMAIIDGLLLQMILNPQIFNRRTAIEEVLSLVLVGIRRKRR